MGWQRSSAGLTAGSQPAPLAGLDETAISSASNSGNRRDASERRYPAERWRALRGSSETAGRPNPEPVDGQKWHPTGPTSSQHDDLLPQHENLGFQRRPRPE